MTTAVTTQVGTMPALPAHLAGKLKPSEGKREGANALITAGIGSDFVAVPRISIEGQRFDVLVDGKRITIMGKDDEGNPTPAKAINVVIVGANPGKYKSLFAEVAPDGTVKMKKWKPGQEAERPLCYSFDGERPSPMAEAPQCATCKACPHNVWGSLINESGNKTRACSDGKLLAVIPYSAVKSKADPSTMQGMAFQLKVSATALSRSKEDRKAAPNEAWSLSEYISLLNNYPVQGGNVEVPVRSVSTRLFFGKVEYPLLQFKLAAQPWLTEDELAYVERRAEGDDIKLLVEEQGVDHAAPGAAAALPAPPPAPVLSAPAQTAPAPSAEPPKPRRGRPAAAQPAPPAAAAPAPVSPAGAAVAAGNGADDEDGVITFGAAATPAPAQTAPKAPPAQPTGADMDNALAGVADLFG